MNDIFKELARQAEFSENDLYTQGDNFQYFAELIVRECIWALWTEECRTSDLASEEYTRGSNKIKQHFGVEE